MLNIGPYQITREIARNGIGQSFEAVDQASKKKVILQHLDPERVAPEVLPRLYSEAKTLASLNHPHIARVFGFVRREDDLYLVMEFVAGQTLENLLKSRGRLRPEVALVFFHQIMAGVAFAHRLGVIHGSLKPSNILVTTFGPLKILNFAIAHILGSSHPTGAHGSERYISPEQIEGKSPDARSDIYSLGLVLYELVVGKSPFDAYGSSDERVAKEQDRFIPAPPSSVVPDLPKWLDEFLLRMLAASPSQRFQSVKTAARVFDAEVARITKRASSERLGLWRQHGSDPIASCKNLLFAAGNWSLDSIKKAVPAIARFSAKPARLVAHLTMASVESALITVERAVRWTSSASHQFVPVSERLLESFKTGLPFHFKAEWKRYAQAACLLILISVETFYFHGANISLLIDGGLLSRPSLNDSVDSMFARINQEAIKTDVKETKKPELVSVVEHKNPNRQWTEKPAIPAAVIVRSEALPKMPDNRAPTSSSPIAANSQTEANAPPIHDVKEPHFVKEQNIVEPVRTARNTAAKSELNVKWEN